MIAKIIEACVRNRVLVLIVWGLITFWGIYCATHIPVDAIPDLSDVQVIIRTEFPEQAPSVVEDQVTYPLTTAMLAVPRTKVVRGYSQYGLSLVYVIFQDGTDIYWARSRVLEYLNYVRGKLPPQVSPSLGPDATGVGWVFEYTLEDPTGQHDLSQLRSIQDWYLRYQLQTVPGVAEVASVGGFVKTYQVVVDPNQLVAYKLPLSKIKEAVKRSNQDSGGALVEQSQTEFMVRTLGYIKNIQDLENIVVGTDSKGTPILVKDIALVRLGPELRRGIAEGNGQGEVVGGIIVMRFGQNARDVIEGVKEKLQDLKTGLPSGVIIKTAYDRSSLIQRAIDTLKRTILEEIVVVSLVCFIFLLHIRSAIVAIISLPLGVLISLILQYQFDINANILSLAGIAIAIGAMVDASVVMVENSHKHIEHAPPDAPREPLILEAAKEVGPSLFFALLVLTVSFLPIFALGSETGRLFRPLAFTKTFAMGGAAVLAITLIPILMIYFIRGKIIPDMENPVARATMVVYKPAVRHILRFPKLAIFLAMVAMAATIYPFMHLGSEFMPPLDEGDLLYMPTTMPGISSTTAKTVLQQTDRIIWTFPEVEYVLGKAGRAETATDPAPLSMFETTIRLKPRDEWSRLPTWYSSWAPGWLQAVFEHFSSNHLTTEALIRKMDEAVRFPGLANSWGYPIKIRIDMLSTGIKTPVGLKFLGPDLDVLSRLASEAEGILKKVPGTTSAFAERVTGGYYLDFDIKRREAARYGLTVGDIQDIIASAMGGENITQTVESLERYPVNLRYFQDYRQNLPALRRLLIPTPDGAQIPMEQLADIKVHQGPDMIKSEGSRRTAWVYVDIANIDVGTYVQKAKEAIAARLKMPTGYSLIWSGQYEYMQEAAKKLRVIIPVTLVLVFLLLYLNTHSLIKVGIVMLAVPFSLLGAIWLLYLLGYHLSVGVVVGMLALAGLDAETGVLMLLYLDIAHDQWKKEGRLNTEADLHDAIEHGAVMRVRPKHMTILANLLGLLPIMWATGTGAEVAKRIAAPMVGGVATSYLLELLIYPAIFLLWRRHTDFKRRKTSV
ncbi:MAG: CusA/CzcA family heavy metal efflux RND transporter [Deltaproteobacteria bacterium]|nr:CusA/CzcA family heavy metal efflux RND transporter [Deltaproteobacteria bacterium]